jgi:hypothetical protein
MGAFIPLMFDELSSVPAFVIRMIAITTKFRNTISLRRFDALSNTIYKISV